MKNKISAKLKKKWINLKQSKRLHQCPIPVIGLTGGIASGKTTVSKFFAEKNILVISADQIVKEIYKEKASFDFVKLKIPKVVNGSEIDFKKLREEFFQDDELRLELETFIYKKIPQKFLDRILPGSKCVVYDIPLLFEKNLANLVDVKVLVYANQDIQMERLIARDDIIFSAAKEMLCKQWPIDEKKSQVDLIIDNTHELKDLKTSFSKAYKELFES